MNKCFLSDIELIEKPYRWPVQQYILSLLKDKGAPIRGKTSLSLDPGYIYTRTDDTILVGRHYEWEKRDETV